MPHRLPEFIEPKKLAETGQMLEGDLPIAKMTRLASMLNSGTGNVVLKLVFGVDETGVVNISGNISADVQLLCQRCMEPMQHKVRETVSLAVVRSEQQIQNLPDYYDPLMVDAGGMASLSHLVEDEIILALPVSVLHDLNDCPARDDVENYVRKQNVKKQNEKNQDVSEDDESQAKSLQRSNPFAALEQLKKK